MTCPKYYAEIYCLKFVFRPELRFGVVGDFNASAKEVPGRGTLLVLMLVLVLVLVLGGGVN